MIPDPQRVFERLQREGVAAAPDTLDVRPETGREDQIIEGQPLPVGEQELVRSRSAATALASRKRARCAVHEASRVVGDVLDVQNRARNLVDQRLEEVVVARIDEGDISRRPLELPRGRGSAHAPPTITTFGAWFLRHRGSPAIAANDRWAGGNPERNEDPKVPRRHVAGPQQVLPGIALDVVAELEEHRQSGPDRPIDSASRVVARASVAAGPKNRARAARSAVPLKSDSPSSPLLDPCRRAHGRPR